MEKKNKKSFGNDKNEYKLLFDPNFEDQIANHNKDLIARNTTAYLQESCSVFRFKCRNR